MNIPGATLQAFVAAAHKVAAHRLSRCSSGNLSYRLDEKHLIVKGHGAWMSELTTEDISLCRLSDGAPVNSKRPSVEIGFHAGILRARPELNVVLHFQTPCATALASREPAITDFYAIPEIAYYIGPIATVPYYHGGSQQLADAVVAAMTTHNLCMLSNHGQVTVGKTYNEAIQRAAFIELACEIIIHNGGVHRPLSAKHNEELRALGGGGKGV